MAENDRRETTRPVKPKVPNDGLPLFEPFRWYRRDWLQSRIGCSNHTWARWVAAGLTITSPGTRAELVFTDENIDRVLRMSDSQLPPPYKSPHAEKNAARRKGKAS